MRTYRWSPNIKFGRCVMSDYEILSLLIKITTLIIAILTLVKKN
ncbi:putative holin-like toxin [Peptoniphilus asaccharolyticus]